MRPGSVPNIGLFDVLEHIENDTMFARHLFELVRPGGFLYLTVPAFNWLWSMSDVDAMHYRRYTRRSLGTLLANRFDVLYSTYLFQRLVPISFLTRALPYALGLARTKPASAYKTDHAAGSRWLAATLNRWLEGEVSMIAAGRTAQVGSSLLVVARRVDGATV